ncbi:stalk domain-containing protein [Paenibacillus xylanexedens]|uniref:stalk domain-containing protein n=1 Tax=Paenibacillus xylanexedens TaxID=528191 RepID=UPI0021B477B4|nr:stalk domain-containing protein [Paenibacillus xylanexedens]
MKKLVSKIPTFMLGAIVGIALTAGTAVGAATYLKATQSNVKIIVDGTQAKLSESPLNVNGKLYLPIRDTANAMGYSVESVTSSQVSLKEGISKSNATTNNGSTETSVNNPSNSNNTTTTNNTGGQYVQGLHEKYSTDGKLDAAKIKEAITTKKISVNAQDKETGNSLMHYVVLENNYSLFIAIKRNALDVNLQNNEKQTPLHLAVINKNSFYYGELRDLKANPTIEDKNSLLPIDYAEKNSVFDIGLDAYMRFYK